MASRLNDESWNHSFVECERCGKLSLRAKIYPCCLCCRRLCSKCRTKSMVTADDKDRSSHRFVGGICDSCLERHGTLHDIDPEERLATFEPLEIRNDAGPSQERELSSLGAGVAAMDTRKLAEECWGCQKVMLARNMSPGRFCRACCRREWFCHTCKMENLAPKFQNGECRKCARLRAAATNAGRPSKVWKLRSLKVKELENLYIMQQGSAPSVITCAELGIDLDGAENDPVRRRMSSPPRIQDASDAPAPRASAERANASGALDRSTDGRSPAVDANKGRERGDWSPGLTRGVKCGLACAGITLSVGVAVWLVSGRRPPRH